MENAENGEVGGKVMIGAPFAGNEKRFSYTEEQKKLVIGRQVPPHTREDDLRYFWTVAEARGLDPFCDYLYGEYEDEPTGGWNFRVHPTLAGYRFKAEETGEYRGTTTPEFCGDDGQWTEAWLKQEPPAACKVGVKRKEFTEPQYHIVLMKDWVQLMEVNPYWKLSPEMSLAARAETGALKKAFPSLGGGVTMEERLDPRLINEVTQGMKASRDIPITRTGETSPDADSTASKPEVAKQGGPNGENSPTKADVGTGGLGFDGVVFDAEIPYEKKELRGSTFGTIKSAQFQSLARKYGAASVENNGTWKSALQVILTELQVVGDALKGTALVSSEGTKIAGKEIRLGLDTLRGLRLGKVELQGIDEELARRIASDSLSRLPLGASEQFLGEFNAAKQPPQQDEDAGKKNGKGVGSITV